jgi:hypothetical protein
MLNRFTPFSFLNPARSLGLLMMSGLFNSACSTSPTISPDPPLPFPYSDGGHPDAGSPEDAGMAIDAGPIPCIPDPCNGLIDTSRGEPGAALCLSFTEKQEAAGLITTGNNLGLSLVDYDQNGKQDVYLLKDGQPNQMFQNQGDGIFLDVSQRTGLAIGGQSRDAAWSQNRDLLLTGADGSHLYKNQNGIFVPVTGGGSGIEDFDSGKKAVWLGVDLLLSTENGIKFYRHLNGDNFQEAAIEIGLEDPGEGGAIAVGDYNGDGLDDVYLANVTGQNRLFQHKADGTYASVETQTMTIGSGNGTDAQWVRFQGEILPSLYVANYFGANQLYSNQQNGAFTEVAGSLGIADPGQTTTNAWGDFLNEERPALFLGHWAQKNLLYVPQLSGTSKTVVGYTEIAHPLGMDLTGQTLKSGWFDYDGDGKLDLLVVLADGGLKLYRNETHGVRTCP